MVLCPALERGLEVASWGPGPLGPEAPWWTRRVLVNPLGKLSAGPGMAASGCRLDQSSLSVPPRETLASCISVPLAASLFSRGIGVTTATTVPCSGDPVLCRSRYAHLHRFAKAQNC